MVEFGSKRCRTVALMALLGLSLMAGGCTTIRKTLDFAPDPELQRKGVYPNINESGPPQPGKAMTAEEQEATKAALMERAAASGPAAGAAAKAEGQASAEELSTIAKTHGEQALEDIQNACETAKPVDATKCPQ